MRKIPIWKKNEIVDYALVDDEDFDRVNRYSWHLHTSGHARSGTTIKRKKVKFYMHRYILNSQQGVSIDHINRNKLDNQKHNLRIATQFQNSVNSPSKKGSTSRYKGVSWQSARNKWVVSIEKDEKVYFVGRFDNEDEAGLAYNKKALELFGEFAYLNEVGDKNA